MKLIISILVIIIMINGCEQKPYLNTNLSIEERVNDLVGRMTLEEKVSQMINAASAIDHLQIPEYNWWNECLHGVARAGIATVFPQAIGLGATWDEKLMYDVSVAISDEARAKHHNFVKNNERLIYQGLTFWSPNINIFRDPRWGRGQETYGEDPFLTGSMAVQFIKGLQGNDPHYFKTIATVKHFAVHSGPEPLRHSFDAITTQRELHEFYLPQFEMGIKEGKAYSVMCAYNRYEGEACCGSDLLLNKILRDDWDFKGYVVSDCGAVGDIYKHHKITKTAEEAAALAVKSGTDLNCGTVYESLVKAVKDGLISEKEIDVSVKRLFTARFKLGMFDPDNMVKYAQIPYSVVDSKEHKKLALKAAQKSMVLLKNENHILPLRKDLGKVAVIGPNADNWTMLLGNYNGWPSNPITPLKGIKEKLSGHSEVLYAKGSEIVAGLPTFELIPSEAFSQAGGQPGLHADYYTSNKHDTDILYSETDTVVDKNWKEGAPRKDMDANNFGVIWNGFIKVPETGFYQLAINTTCKIDYYFEDSLLINTAYHFRDEFSDPRIRKSKPVYLKAGKKYKIRVEAGESYGVANISLLWSRPRKNPAAQLLKEAVNVARQANIVILCMGLTAGVEGEQMDIEVDGFNGGDRTRLDLPDVQQHLIREIQALGKPVILVLLNGSALAVNWSEKNIPAILEAWYPGQAAGQAIADVLFGDYNPGGKLPVTFYKSVNDLPSFEEYHLTSQTYQYFSGLPLFPFGYGLSYTTFDYNGLKIPDRIEIGDSVLIAVKVKNSGAMDGDEVVQVYASRLNDPAAPIRKLVAFKRIHLKTGEEKTVQLPLKPDAFATFSDNGVKQILPGKFNISVGGGQPVKGVKTLNSFVQVVNKI